MKRFKVGDEVRIEFQDHSHNLKSTITCVVYGKIYLIDDTQVVIDSWYSPGEKDRDLGDTVECFGIVRSTIHNMTRLVDEE